MFTNSLFCEYLNEYEIDIFDDLSNVENEFELDGKRECDFDFVTWLLNLHQTECPTHRPRPRPPRNEINEKMKMK